MAGRDEDFRAMEKAILGCVFIVLFLVLLPFFWADAHPDAAGIVCGTLLFVAAALVVLTVWAILNHKTPGKSDENRDG